MLVLAVQVAGKPFTRDLVKSDGFPDRHQTTP